MQQPYTRGFSAVLLVVLIIFSGSIEAYGEKVTSTIVAPATVWEVNNRMYKVSKVDTGRQLVKGLKSLSLMLSSTKKEYILKLYTGNRTVTYKVGVNDFVYNSGGIFWDKDCWLKGLWTDGHTFRVSIKGEDEDVDNTYTFCFTGNAVVVLAENTEIRAYSDNTYVPDGLVAHGGGGIIRNNKLVAYSNSLEALNESYNKGYRLIEVDIEWTLDNELVLVHDWGDGFKYNFSAKAKRYSLKEFKALKMKNNLTTLTVKELEDWSKKHPDVRIITDIKSKNILALKKISKENPFLKKQLIPQIYAFTQYTEAAELGYKRSLLALWGTGITDEKKILEFARKNKIFAVSISEERNKNYPKLSPEFKKLGVFAFIHTINSVDTYGKLVEAGAFGVFTDSISHKDMNPQ